MATAEPNTICMEIIRIVYIKHTIISVRAYDCSRLLCVSHWINPRGYVTITRARGCGGLLENYLYVPRERVVQKTRAGIIVSCGLPIRWVLLQYFVTLT